MKVTVFCDIARLHVAMSQKAVTFKMSSLLESRITDLDI
jgi:hypothetical protein